MRNETRQAYTGLLTQVAKLNGVGSAAEAFTVTPSVQQKLETAIQESSDFLKKINIIGVDEKDGEAIALGVGSSIAGRTDTTQNARSPRDVSALTKDTYSCKKTDFDTATVSVLSIEGDGTPDQALLDLVTVALNDEDVRPLGDRVTVQPAQILPFSITAAIHLASFTAEAELIEAQARQRLIALITQRHRLGLDVRRSALDAAMHIEGVRFVELAEWVDIVPDETQAPWCTGIDLTIIEAGS